MEDQYINLKELHDWLHNNFFWIDMDVDEFYGKVESELTIYTEWMDAANTATDRLFDCVKNNAEPQIIRLYEVLSIASSLCAVAAAIKERKVLIHGMDTGTTQTV